MAAVALGGGVRSAAAGAGSLAPLSNPELLTDPSFAQPGIGPWQTGPGQNRAVYQSSSAPVGQNYLETNSGTAAGPSVFQDVPAGPVPGHSYTASVLLRAPAATPFSVSMVVWALGGSAPNEIGQTVFTVSSSTWSRFSTTLDIGSSGHTFLRFQVYINTPTQNLDLDGAMLQDSGVGDAGFGQGIGTWAVNPGQNRSIYQSASAPSGQHYVEVNSGTTQGASFYQDLSSIPIVGHTYAASVFLRSPGASATSVSVVVWALGGSAPNELGQTQFTVSSSNWTQYFANLDVAGPQLQEGGVPDGGFDQSGLGPWVASPGTAASTQSGSGALAGTTWLQASYGSGASGSVYQDLGTNTLVGHPYTLSVYVRATGITPISASLALWALGGGSTELGSTQVTVGQTWTPVSAVLTPANAGHFDLRVQVYLNTPGQTLAVDNTTLPDTAIDPPLGPASLPTGVGVYGPSSYQSLSTAISQGWPVIGDTGGLGTQQSPYTGSLGPPAPDLGAAQAIAHGGRAVTWLSFWTVSAPSAGDSWFGDGYAAGHYVAAFLDSVSSSIKPAFVILDPEGYANGQPNPYPTNAVDWNSWVTGWASGITAVDGTLTPALYVWQNLYTTNSMTSIRMPVFMAISPILGNFPGNGTGFVAGANVDGYIAFSASCPAGPYVSTMQSWGGSYNTLQFNDSGADCAPSP